MRDINDIQCPSVCSKKEENQRRYSTVWYSNSSLPATLHLALLLFLVRPSPWYSDSVSLADVTDGAPTTLLSHMESSCFCGVSLVNQKNNYQKMKSSKYSKGWSRTSGRYSRLALRAVMSSSPGGLIVRELWLRLPATRGASPLSILVEMLVTVPASRLPWFLALVVRVVSARMMMVPGGKMHKYI